MEDRDLEILAIWFTSAALALGQGQPSGPVARRAQNNILNPGVSGGPAGRPGATNRRSASSLVRHWRLSDVLAQPQPGSPAPWSE